MKRPAAVLLWLVIAASGVGGTMGVAEAAPRKKAPAKKVVPPPPEPEPAPTPEPTPPPAPSPLAPNGTKKRLVGILDVRFEGIPDDVASDFEKNLEGSLDTNTYWLSSRANMRDRLRFSTKWTEGCVVGDCLREVRVQTQAELALLVSISGSGTSYGYVITLVRTDNGKVFTQDSGRCDVCVVREVMRDVTLATIDLLNQVPDTLPDEANERTAAIELAVGKVDRRMRAAAGHGKKKAIVVTIVGLAVAGAGAGIYFASDKPNYALAMMGGGGGFALGGITILAF